MPEGFKGSDLSLKHFNHFPDFCWNRFVCKTCHIQHDQKNLAQLVRSALKSLDFLSFTGKTRNIELHWHGFRSSYVLPFKHWDMNSPQNLYPKSISIFLIACYQPATLFLEPIYPRNPIPDSRFPIFFLH